MPGLTVFYYRGMKEGFEHMDPKKRKMGDTATSTAGEEVLTDGSKVPPLARTTSFGPIAPVSADASPAVPPSLPSIPQLVRSASGWHFDVQQP